MVEDVKYSDIYDHAFGTDEFNVSIFIGMRGMGKTFSALSPLYKECDEMQKKLFTRLTLDEVDMITSPVGNVFKDINIEFPDHPPYMCFPIKKSMYGVYTYDIDPETDKPFAYGDMVSYVCSIVTLCKVCGMGFSDVSEFIVDEFIPRRKGSYHGDKFKDIMSCWETINRNREAKGRPACKLILLSNSNNIYDDVLRGFGLVSQAEKMCAEGKQDYFDMERSIALHIMKPSETFKEFKQNSAVARATKGTDYFEMAFDNKFAYNDFSFIEHKTMQGWTPIFGVSGEGWMYRKKNKYHFTYRRANVPNYRIDGYIFHKQFVRDFGYLDFSYSQGLITFESYELKELFLSAIC